MQKIFLGNFLFGFVKLTKNDDFDQYKYSWCGIGFDEHGTFSILNGTGFAKNVIIWVEMLCSSVDIDNKKKYILILIKGPTNGWDDITFTAEKEYAINFTEQQNKYFISLHYNGLNSNIFC